MNLDHIHMVKVSGVSKWENNMKPYYILVSETKEPGWYYQKNGSEVGPFKTKDECYEKKN